MAGKRAITADTTLRLGQYFGMSADFGMNLQKMYEVGQVSNFQRVAYLDVEQKYVVGCSC